MNRFLAVLCLGALSSAAAQLQVQVPGNSALCVQTATVTPVIGIAMSSYLEGDYPVEYTAAVHDALQMAGFKVQVDDAYPLPDLASIFIRGRMDAWKTRSGHLSSRVGDVSLDVVDLGSEETLLTVKQQQAPFVFQAPSSANFALDVARVVSEHFCQLR